MADTKIDMALDDIIKKNRNGPRNQRGRGGNNVQRRGGNNQRGNRGGRIGKPNNNNRNSGGNFRRGTGRNSFGQRNNNNINNNRSNKYETRELTVGEMKQKPFLLRLVFVNNNVANEIQFPDIIDEISAVINLLQR